MNTPLKSGSPLSAGGFVPNATDKNLTASVGTTGIFGPGQTFTLLRVPKAASLSLSEQVELRCDTEGGVVRDLRTTGDATANATITDSLLEFKPSQTYNFNASDFSGAFLSVAAQMPSIFGATAQEGNTKLEILFTSQVEPIATATYALGDTLGGDGERPALGQNYWIFSGADVTTRAESGGRWEWVIDVSDITGSGVTSSYPAVTPTVFGASTQEDNTKLEILFEGGQFDPTAGGVYRVTATTTGEEGINQGYQFSGDDVVGRAAGSRWEWVIDVSDITGTGRNGATLHTIPSGATVTVGGPETSSLTNPSGTVRLGSIQAFEARPVHDGTQLDIFTPAGTLPVAGRNYQLQDTNGNVLQFNGDDVVQRTAAQHSEWQIQAADISGIGLDGGNVPTIAAHPVLWEEQDLAVTFTTTGTVTFPALVPSGYTIQRPPIQVTLEGIANRAAAYYVPGATAPIAYRPIGTADSWTVSIDPTLYPSVRFISRRQGWTQSLSGILDLESSVATSLTEGTQTRLLTTGGGANLYKAGASGIGVAPTVHPSHDFGNSYIKFQAQPSSRPVQMDDMYDFLQDWSVSEAGIVWPIPMRMAELGTGARQGLMVYTVGFEGSTTVGTIAGGVLGGDNPAVPAVVQNQVLAGSDLG